ncbi:MULTISPECIES: NADH-quinone oxidoreductase subunit NuoE [Anoxynatronum]|uniref:NADH-quinone oxidoreductase subunit E n=2 Tax=Anoxynatronum TaxID=210622 RepID=A0AA46AKB0_9CLOT|nr:NADH-quinone oxidoreductase subunit NuoE [Anoxynatronum buryatiense]SMP68142.1 NADH-quinone oxidoreductase subunit E [Anoxynatronum buryatiense]
MQCCGGQGPQAPNEITSNFDLNLLAPVLKKYGQKPGSLITILQKAQEIYGYLPMDVLDYIAAQTGIKPPNVYGVATFYTQFRLNPVGEYLIMLCMGTACHVNGAGAIEDAICDELKIQDGETTADNLFTLNNVACLGCCSLSPVMMINGETYAKLTPEKTRKILRDLRKQHQQQEKEATS